MGNDFNQINVYGQNEKAISKSKNSQQKLSLFFSMQTPQKSE